MRAGNSLPWLHQSTVKEGGGLSLMTGPVVIAEDVAAQLCWAEVVRDLFPQNRGC